MSMIIISLIIANVFIVRNLFHHLTFVTLYNYVIMYKMLVGAIMMLLICIHMRTYVSY